MRFDAVVVGAGIAGAVLARCLAEEKLESVLVVEKRNYIGGYCHDYRNEDGILIHSHGPHIFRTDSARVWRFLSRFTDWHDYQHKVLANVNGHYYPMPINLDTVNLFLGTDYTSETVEDYFSSHRTVPAQVRNVKDVIESTIGPEFFQAFFEKYTEKQWGLPCEELPPEIVARIPIRRNRDDRYFTHRYQALPKDGYTNMIRSILDHPRISLLLNTNYKDIRGELECGHTYITGPIDEYYDHCYGKLPYRSVAFTFERLPMPRFQSVAVVNYPNNYDYTRITEFNHFYNQRTENTVIAKEYPGAGGDPSYPIPTEKNLELYNRYAAIPNDNTTFVGRLGEYRYYSMDQIVERILNDFFTMK